MKTIKIANGELRKGCEFDDLNEEAQARVITDHIQFEIDIMTDDSPYYNCVIKMDQMQTPWFLAQAIWDDYKDEIIENIKINNYLFDEDGNLLPIQYHHGKQSIIVKTLWRDKYECIIEQI